MLIYCRADRFRRGLEIINLNITWELCFHILVVTLNILPTSLCRNKLLEWETCIIVQLHGMVKAVAKVAACQVVHNRIEEVYRVWVHGMIVDT